MKVNIDTISLNVYHDGKVDYDFLKLNLSKPWYVINIGLSAEEFLDKTKVLITVEKGYKIREIKKWLMSGYL